MNSVEKEYMISCETDALCLTLEEVQEKIVRLRENIAFDEKHGIPVRKEDSLKLKGFEKARLRMVGSGKHL